MMFFISSDLSTKIVLYAQQVLFSICCLVKCGHYIANGDRLVLTKGT